MKTFEVASRNMPKVKKKPSNQTTLQFKQVLKPCSKESYSAAQSSHQSATNVPDNKQIIFTSSITDAISETSDSNDEKSFHLTVQEAFAALPTRVRDKVMTEANSTSDLGGPDQASMFLFEKKSHASLVQCLENTGLVAMDIETAVMLITDIVSALSGRY